MMYFQRSILCNANNCLAIFLADYNMRPVLGYIAYPFLIQISYFIQGIHSPLFCDILILAISKDGLNGISI